jgi:serine/threonine protein kinase
LGDRINAGGTNDVFRADYWLENRRTGKISPRRQIVVKFGKPYAAPGDKRMHRLNMVMGAFQDEIRINNLVRATNIEGVAQSIGGGSAGRLLYLKMDYIKGISLDQTFRNDLSEEEQLRRLAKMAYLGNTISQLHYYHIIHKDIKPRNLILCQDTQSVHNHKILIIDFGFSNSKLRDSVTEYGGQITPNYAAPEQILMGENLSASVDYFSYGVVLHEYLTGYSLFPDALKIFLEDEYTITDRYMDHLRTGRQNRYEGIPEITQLINDLTTFDSNERMQKCRNLFDMAHRMRELINETGFRDINTDFLWNQLQEYKHN